MPPVEVSVGYLLAMPRNVAIQELATLLGVLSHPARIRIVEELRVSEHDVNHLAMVLEVSHSRVSQHLSVMRAHRMVQTRREGRRVFYSLADRRLAGWLVDGLDFLQAEVEAGERLRSAVAEARSLFSDAER
jgi:DNA-binding transcriptional ArsR family regulator